MLSEARVLQCHCEEARFAALRVGGARSNHSVGWVTATRRGAQKIDSATRSATEAGGIASAGQTRSVCLCSRHKTAADRWSEFGTGSGASGPRVSRRPADRPASEVSRGVGGSRASSARSHRLGAAAAAGRPVPSNML